METPVVRSFCLIAAFFAFVTFAGALRADTYQLTTGETLNGEVLATSANDAGVQVKVGEGEYKKVPWDSFSQEDLRKFRDDPKLSPKLGPFIEPFIVITPEERVKKTEVPIKQPTRLAHPAAQSLFGALISSGLGLFLLLVVYGATIYAGYEVAIFRAQPVPLVAGLSAIPLLGVLAPIIFLAMPTKTQPIEQTWETQAASRPESKAEAVNPMQGETPQHPAGLRLADTQSPSSEPGAPSAAPAETKPALPATQTFPRGQFTFNRRFIETKFGGFFGVVRHGADKDMVLLVKAARGQYVCNRITRIAANDMHVEVLHGHATEEIMIPFQEIKEIQLKHKDAP
jgi:hypothetical protein